MKLTLPTDSATRKEVPLYSGCYSYFPAALAGVAMHSKISNEKHNPGEPLHHSRGKSSDHADCIVRHLMDLADMQARRVVWTADEEEALLTEANALCWRALALSQEIHEKIGAPLAPAARKPGPEKPLTFNDFPYAGYDTCNELGPYKAAHAVGPTQYYRDVQKAGDGRQYASTIQEQVRRNQQETNRACDALAQSVSRSGSFESGLRPVRYDQILAQDRACGQTQQNLNGLDTYGRFDDPA